MKQSKSLYLFVLPGLLLYLLFFVYPTINGLILSFTDWEGISPEWNWVGLANYEKMLFGDMIFKKSHGQQFEVYALRSLVSNRVLSGFGDFAAEKFENERFSARALLFFQRLFPRSP